MPLRCFFYSAEKWLHDESRRTRIEGSILEPTQNTAGKFRRLGVFNMVGHETAYAFLRTVYRGLEYEEVVNPIDCASWRKITNEEVKWTAKQYIINII
jgi:hypothetical protein